MMALKILVCGDVCGNFRLLFERVEKLNKKKGPFDFLLCVGNFFGASRSNWEPYKTGALKAPLLTYILGPNEEEHINYYSDPNGCELCSNIYSLGKRGILTSSGLRIAYMSGSEKSVLDNVKITEKDAEAVRNIAYKGKDPNEYLGVDVLITSDWPKDVTNLIGTVDDNVKNAAENGSPLVAWLVSQLKPRYHFAGLNDIFYERPPYRNHQRNAVGNTHCTRFIALSSLNGKKWMYGAVLTPIDQIKKSELYQRTADETECPYQDFTNTDPKSEQFFFDMNAKDKEKTSRKRKRDFSQEKCWFCLAGGQDLNTVISIGTEAYVAIPKGGLALRHLIICPIKHLESYLHLPRNVRNEVTEMKKAVKKYYEKSKEVPVFFERYFRTSHMQLNAVPVSESRAKNLTKAFMREAQKQSIELIDIPSGTELGEILRLETPYLFVELPNEEGFYVRCEQNFPLHFARVALTCKEVLDAKERVDWKKCVLPDDEEQELSKQLRKDFAEFYSGN